MDAMTYVTGRKGQWIEGVGSFTERLRGGGTPLSQQCGGVPQAWSKKWGAPCLAVFETLRLRSGQAMGTISIAETP